MFFLVVNEKVVDHEVKESENSTDSYLLAGVGVGPFAFVNQLEVITGVDLGKMLPIPNLDNKKFDAARKFEDQGIHLRLYTFSDTDYRDIDKIWKGPHPIDGKPLKVFDGMPAGAPVPDLEEVPEEFAQVFRKKILMKLRKDCFDLQAYKKLAVLMASFCFMQD